MNKNKTKSIRSDANPEIKDLARTDNKVVINKKYQDSFQDGWCFIIGRIGTASKLANEAINTIVNTNDLLPVLPMPAITFFIRRNRGEIIMTIQHKNNIYVMKLIQTISNFEKMVISRREKVGNGCHNKRNDKPVNQPWLFKTLIAPILISFY